jgi:hypothetical protein
MAQPAKTVLISLTKHDKGHAAGHAMGGFEGCYPSHQRGVRLLPTARQVLELATRGGAVRSWKNRYRVRLNPANVLISFPLTLTSGLCSALHDPVAAVIFCQPQNVDNNYVSRQGCRPQP